MKQLIYAADDEKDILEVIEGFLENAGFDVCIFSTGDALYEAFREKPCDLVVLDIMMPGRDGLTICRELRAISDVPIVILTAKESETDHMRGFMLGGDDYLIKPFSPSLLVVRIQALLRRVGMSGPVHSSLSFGDITYSEESHDALCNGKSIGLTMTEFSLLGCLIKNAGSAVSRNELLDNVWGIDNNDIETRVTDETVRRIRRKMREAGSSVKITAIWGYGYKLEEGDE
ncbi:response regulator transcription factor [Ruminococcus sp. XPD3002]|uniref:response regulator transcription factor n=1 Tax=Ruminococcus sp. XPD3002 TaxID=1452269 RepID=UPI000921EA5B|nr:DNA-binding response regulator, OmpR family, contains REC and winged-helix (wHTH) domain [Ruminococcus flavefaciens]